MSEEQSVNSVKKTSTIGWVAFGLALLGFISQSFQGSHLLPG